MRDEQEQRHVYYDGDLDIEAYNLKGIVQKFPNHFHEYYVIGFIEGGQRHLWCKGKEYDLKAGDVILFNPHDNHYCEPINGEVLDYRAVNIKMDIMLDAIYEITGQRYIPHFTQNVVYQSNITQYIGKLYNTILCQLVKSEKEKAFYELIEMILKDYIEPFHKEHVSQFNEEIQMLCSYMKNHYTDNITLDDLVEMTTFGKSYLVRIFTKQTGVSPYRYLQAIRLDKAKELLEQGIDIVDVAHQTGFSDQSHLSHYFKEFIGLTPKQYQKIFIEDFSHGK